MKVFVWFRLDHVSGNYHEEGGLVVVAYGIERALELATAAGVKVNQAVDRVYDVEGDAPEEVMIFPDAGCC